MNEPARRKRLRLALSVKMPMLLLVPLAVWLGWVTNKARQQGDAVIAIREYGGSVRYDYEYVDGIPRPGQRQAPRWLRRILGDAYFQEVVEVNFFSEYDHEGQSRRARAKTEEVLSHLRRLPQLKRLNLESEQATDEGLRRITNLRDLEGLFIWDARRLSDAKIAHLASMRNLKKLHIGDCNMTDVGLAHLKGLTGLEVLVIPGSHLTDEGLAHIEGLKNLRVLHIVGGRHITDAGMIHLAGLTGLELLTMNQREVTDGGLEHLKGLSRLRQLVIVGTKVTDDGIRKLKEALSSLKSVKK